jgi:hypothetical protein
MWIKLGVQFVALIRKFAKNGREKLANLSSLRCNHSIWKE